MQRLLRLLAVLCACSLAGCANFTVVKKFAAETNAMTGVARAEMREMAKLCEFPADMQLLIDESRRRQDDPKAQGKRLKAACASVNAESVELQTLTVDTLDAYAGALRAMADGDNFEVRSAIESTGGKLAALQTRDGVALVNREKAGALTQLLAFIGDVVVRYKREAGVRKLVEVDRALIDNATALREFFVRKDGRPSPYFNVVSTGQGLRGDLEADLELVARQEPLRAAEIRRMIAPEQAFTDRIGSSPDKIPAKVAKTIDDWIALVPSFKKDALTPDPKALLEQLDVLHQNALATRDAIERAGF